MSFLPLVKAWIWISALATLAGWALSAVGQLNRLGYATFFSIALLLWWLNRAFTPSIQGTLRTSDFGRRTSFGFCRGKLRFRFTHLLAACFLLLAFLAFLGGVLYPPTNHAGLTYRTPRVLQWLTAEHWFWIHTPNYRMNNRACGIEWLTAPLLLLTRSDRALFLINFLPFLLLPGLLFSTFTRLGVRGRVAWSWMWILPTGYCFLLQAGSLANDTFPAVYALAAVDFGLRAYVSRKPSDLFYSIISAALLTGAKASNLPLLLSWAIVAALLISLMKRRLFLSTAVVIAALLVSFLPTAALNFAYCGDWSGLKLERAGMEMKSPLVGLWGNGFLLLLNNLVPPFFPQAGWWNQSALTLLPAAVVKPLTANFEAGFHLLWEMPTEDWVGLGFGVTALAIVSLAAGGRFQIGARTGVGEVPGWLRWAMLLAPWAALLVYCMKSGMVTGARLISPYYPLLMPLLLLGTRQARLVRSAWWRLSAAAVCLIAIPVVVLTPARPLWPACTLLSRLAEAKPEQRLIARALKVYTVYRERWDPLASARALLPPGTRTVGFLADGDDMDLSLWRPFFAREVKHILLRDTAEQIRTRGIEYAFVGGAFLAAEGVSFDDWRQRAQAESIASTTCTIKVNEGPQPWYLVRFRGSP